MIELRWLHDTFDKAEDISEHAVLVRDKHGNHRPLILQYRDDYIDRYLELPHEKPWITVKCYNPPKDKP